MSEILKVQLEDSEGNVYYLKNDANNVFCTDGQSVQTKLNNTINKSDLIQDSNTNDTTKVVSAAVTKNIQDQINNFKSDIINHETTKLINCNSEYFVTDYLFCMDNFDGTYNIIGNVQILKEIDSANASEVAFGFPFVAKYNIDIPCIGNKNHVKMMRINANSNAISLVGDKVSIWPANEMFFINFTVQTAFVKK